MTNSIEMISRLGLSMPNWVAALILLLGGWCAAMFARIIIYKILELARFNQMCKKAGVIEFLRKGQVSYSPARLIGVSVYWIILLVVLFWSANLLNIKMAKMLTEQFVTAVPGFVAALLILVIGVIVVSFIGNFVMTIARNAGFPHARLLSKVTKALGIIVVFSLTVEQANIGTTLIISIFLILIGAVAFGCALAFGLGCKDMAHDVMERFLHDLREKIRTGSDSDLEG